MAQAGNSALRQIRAVFTILLCGMAYTMVSFIAAGSVFTTAVEGPEITPERMEQIHRWFSLSQMLRYPVVILENVFQALGVPHFFLISTYLVGMCLGLMMVLLQRRLATKV
jgi:Na+-driven multidrug efflux pump